GGEFGQHGPQLGGGDLRDQRPAIGPVPVEPLDVGEHHQLLRVQALRDGRRGEVGVDVEHLARGGAVGRDLGGDGGDHRDPAGVQQVTDGFDAHAGHGSDVAEVDVLAVDDGGAAHGGEHPGVLAGHPDGVRAVLVDQPHELPADLPDQHHPHDVHGVAVGHAQAAAEGGVDADAVEHGGDLGAAAVDDDHMDAGQAHEHHVGGEGAAQLVVDHGVAAVLDDHDPAAEALHP